MYGVNFGRPPIPKPIIKKFGERLNRNLKVVGWDKGCEWILVGVAENKPDLDYMMAVANNGHRKLRFTEKDGLYGIYSS